MTTGQLIAELVDRLGRIAQGLQYAEGLKPAQWEALRFVAGANRNSRTPSALAGYLGSTKGTVSQTLIALETKGLIRRERSSADRRSVEIDLTEAGRTLIARDPLNTIREAAAGLSGDERTVLVTAMDRLIGALQTAKGKPLFGPCMECVYLAPDDGNGGREPPCRCALSGTTVPHAEAVRLCVDFEPAEAAS